jgi:glycosyltransferase involved in cell wall biosynthesis
VSATPRIAIACSGLGHVQRGIESWAADLALALRRAGANVTLFGGAPSCGGGVDALPTLRRTGKAAIALAKGLRRFGGWRFGMGSPYDVEQTSFALSLWRRIRSEFDILHVQDPMIATWLERAHRAGVSRPRVIYANGTGENASVMRRFAFLQFLTQAAADDWMPHKPDGQAVFVIPNFIDTGRFHPGDQIAARARFGLPPGQTIILCCAAIRRFHKRIDVLLRAFADVCRGTDTAAMLVIAGGREADSDALIAEGMALLGVRVRFLPDLPRECMPDLYRAADGFVLASLHEMFGIVLLEALATGLPVLCNDTPDFRTIVGPGGLYGDLADQDSLKRGLTDLLRPETRAKLAQAGRGHVARTFSETTVVGAIAGMYHSVQATSSYVR